MFRATVTYRNEFFNRVMTQDWHAETANGVSTILSLAESWQAREGGTLTLARIVVDRNDLTYRDGTVPVEVGPGLFGRAPRQRVTVGPNGPFLSDWLGDLPTDSDEFVGTEWGWQGR